MNIQILHIIASIDPSYGGPVGVIKGLYHGLKSLGVTSTILTCSTGDSARDKTNALAFAGADIVWVNPLVRRYYWRPFLMVKIAKRLQDFDLFHVYGLFNGISSAVCRVARSLNIPYILEPLGTLSPYCLAKSGFIKKVSLALGELKNIENAAAIKFTSEAEYQRFKFNFHARYGFVAGNGLDWIEFRQLPTQGKFREKFNISKHEIVFLFLGRLQPIKGLEIFLPAFIQWRRSQSHRMRCVIAGPNEGGYRKKLENLIIDLNSNDTILLAGPLYGADRIQAIVDSDVIILPSFHENFGIASVEAMACGKPVLVSDQVDIWHEVKKFDLGEVAMLGFDDMIAALNRMIMRKGEWGIIGERGRKWAKENCNWDKIAEIVLNEYIKINSRRGNS